MADKANYGYDQPSDPEVYRGPAQSYPAPVPMTSPGYAPQAGYAPQPVVHQPVTSHSTVVVNTGPPTPVAAPQNIREWTSGLCGCCDDIASCCFAYWCYPCFMCTLSERLGEHCCGPFCCGCMFNTILRNKVRTMYGIRGTAFNDICTVGCCELCAMLQVKRELDSMDTLQNNMNMQQSSVIVSQAHNQY